MQKQNTPPWAKIPAGVLWVIAISCLGCQTNLTVKRVVSADTVILSDGTRVRYAGVVGPEPGSEFAEFARQQNAYLVENKVVRLVTEPALSTSETTVAYLYTPILVENREKYLFVNAELLRFGLVKAVPVPDDCRERKLWESLWAIADQEEMP